MSDLAKEMADEIVDSILKEDQDPYWDAMNILQRMWEHHRWHWKVTYLRMTEEEYIDDYCAELESRMESELYFNNWNVIVNNDPIWRFYPSI